MLNGGLSVDEAMTAHLYVLNNITGAEIWIDSVSLKGFAKAKWREHQNTIIEKVPKRSTRIYVSKEGKGLPGANISISQIRPDFLSAVAQLQALRTTRRPRIGS